MQRLTVEVKGRLLEYAWWMKKQEYADEIIRCNTLALKLLAERGG